MGGRTLVKSLVPARLFPIARAVYRGLQVPRYYVPYVLGNGHAGPPSKLTFELTYRCNLRCAMCPIQLAKEHGADESSRLNGASELSLDEIRALMASAAGMGIRSVVLTGGEPFLRRDLIDIIRCVKSHGLDCTVLSNGMLVDADVAQALVASGLDLLSVSIDGTETTHNRIRGHADAYARATAAVRHVNEARRRAGARRPLVDLGCTILSRNAGELTELVALARDLRVRLALGYLFYTSEQMLESTRCCIELGDVKNEDQDVPMELRDVSWEALADEVRRVKAAAREARVDVTFAPELKGREIQRWFADDDFSCANKCFYPWFSVRVSPFGIVYPCSMNVALGDLRKKTIAEIWNDEPYMGFRRALRRQRLFPKCAKCCALHKRFWSYLPALQPGARHAARQSAVDAPRGSD